MLFPFTINTTLLIIKGTSRKLLSLSLAFHFKRQNIVTISVHETIIDRLAQSTIVNRLIHAPIGCIRSAAYPL